MPECLIIHIYMIVRSQMTTTNRQWTTRITQWYWKI